MIYTYRCTDCQFVFEATRSMDDRHKPIQCPECAAEAKLKVTGGVGFTNVMGGSDMPGYQCPVTDQWVDSKKKRQRIMDEHNLIEKGDTPGVHV